MKNVSANVHKARVEKTFRQLNERVQKGLDKLLQMAREAGQEMLIQDINDPLPYHCECSRATCQERIVIAPSKYKYIHSNRQHFIVVIGHESSAVEAVIQRHDKYLVVEKPLALVQAA